MKEGDIVEYTDHRGAKHDAKVIKVIEQPTNIEQTAHEEIINVEYSAGGRVRVAELVSKNPNASGQCYGKVLSSQDDEEVEDVKEEDSEPEASSEDEEEKAEVEAKPDTAESNEDATDDNTAEVDEEPETKEDPEPTG